MPRKKSKVSKPRASWRGMLQFGLVSVPVQAFNAHAADEGRVAFHQLHAECHSRIKHEKVCPVHGPVSYDEIVSGFESAPGQYVEVDPDELEQLRSDREKALSIDSFVDPAEVDPIYYDGRMYYLTPDGDGAREPYAVFLEALRRQERVGVGQVVFSGKEQVVLLRPYGDVLHMAMLNYAAEMKDPADVLGKLPALRRGDRQVRLAEQLIEQRGEGDFDYTEYVDRYYEQVKELIEAKVEGRELVAPEAEEGPEVLNLMDALRQSITSAKKTSRAKSPARPRRKRTAKSRRKAS